MKKTLVWCGVSVLVVLMAVGAWWMLRPQTITMSDGSKLTLVAVQYGKKHTSPVKGARRGNSINSTNDTLVIWVRQQYDSQEYHYFQYFAYDKAGKACVGTQNYGANRQGNEVVGLQLNGFPRRQSRFVMRVQEQSNGGQELSDQKFTIRNPSQGPFTDLKPDSLPNTQEDDDLSVTLTKLVAGASMPYTRNNDDPDDAMNKGVQATFHVERNGKPVTNWQPVTVETSDATDNRVYGSVAGNQWSGNDDAVTYQYGLWPDEPAWKLRVEFSQQSDFADSEVWSVQNIPLVPGRQQDFYNFNSRRNTNPVFAETDLNGFHLKIVPAIQFTNMPPNAQPQGGLNVQITPSLPNGVRLTLVKLTDDHTNDVANWNWGTSGDGRSTIYRYGLRDLYGATNLNLTVALHKSRFVEFNVKPEQMPATAPGAQ